MRPTRVVPRRGRNLTRLERILLSLEIIVMYSRARRLMGSQNLACTLQVIRRGLDPGGDPRPAPGEPPEHSHEFQAAVRLGRAVMLVLSRLPGDRRCLVRSLVVTSLLVRRQIPSDLVIGVRPETAEPFLAHAWVEYSALPVIPDEGYNRFHAF